MADQNFPIIEFENLFLADDFGQKFFKFKLGTQNFEKYHAHFLKMGSAGAQATPFSRLADVNGPKLIKKSGEADQVVYHSSHTELERLSYGQGIISVKYKSPLIDQDQNIRHQIGFSAGLYFAMTDSGLFCPICMTDALGFVLEKYLKSGGDLPEAKRALKMIGSSDFDQFWQGAMFLTEKQGGSDVGANLVRAEQTSEGRWLLFGEKWFCSNVDAEAALVLARLPGEEGALENGTRGLGLFLLLRDEPINNPKSWDVMRLKEKLGVRSMASGEVTFNGSEAFLLGGFNQGFKMMAEMVNLSRIYNSVASLGVARRSLMEAFEFGKRRSAFGKKLTDQPLWRSSYSDLFAQYVCLKAIVFEAIRLLDQGENELSRILTPICKAMSGKFAVFCASECMELIGGNAYIEEHIMPRLLRDAQVLPIWEGTTHIQSLDLLRTLKKEGVKVLRKRLELSLKNSHDEELKNRVEIEQQKLFKMLAQIQSMPSDEIERLSRSLLDQMTMTLGLSLVFEMLQSPDLKDIARGTIIRMSALGKFLQSPSSSYSADLSKTESAFL